MPFSKKTGSYPALRKDEASAHIHLAGRERWEGTGSVASKATGWRPVNKHCAGGGYTWDRR